MDFNRTTAKDWLLKLILIDRRGAHILSVLAGSVLLTCACATNPVTGNREIVLMSEAQELSLGRDGDAQIRNDMGVYEDQSLQAYVEEVGFELAASSHRPELPWSFTIVDSPAINAFALPGGYIYLTRGIMAYLGDAAELAGVLGHEIGHVTARHAVQAYTRATGATLGMVMGSIFMPPMRASPYGAPGLGDAAGTGLGLLLLRFGRDDETQADRLGAEYAVASGWDPHGVGDMLSTLARIAETNDRRGIPNWLATHPEPEDRVTNVASTVDELLATTSQAGLRVERSGYLNRIDGLLYGDNPDQGIVRGNAFLHPVLRFALEFPEGWEVQNSEAVVVARQSGSENHMILELLEKPQGRGLQQIAENSMDGAGYRLRQGSMTEINGLDAFVGTYGQQVRDLGTVVARVAHIREGRSIYVFGGFAPVDEYSSVERDVYESIRSFRRLGRDEADKIKPNRIAIYTSRDGDTWQKIAQSGGTEIVSASTLAIMNGYAVNHQPVAGDQIKIVVPG